MLRGKCCSAVKASTMPDVRCSKFYFACAALWKIFAFVRFTMKLIENVFYTCKKTLETSHARRAMGQSNRGFRVMKKAILGAVFGAAALLFAGLQISAPAQAEEGRYGKQKVVYHINYDGGEGSKKYYGALRNIQNHINAVGKDNIDVKVVMHGNGLGLLADAQKDLKLQGNVTNLKTQNVAFNVCSNTLKGRKIDPDKDLFEVFKEDIVPSGVAELAYLQAKGYTYIKP